MKKLILLFTVLAFIGCKKEPEVIIDNKDITYVDDIAYLKHDMSLVTGTVKEWHENGQLVFEANFKDGKKVGVYTRWHENGQLWGEGNYKDGKKEGVFKRWHDNGQIRSEETFKDGTRDGVQKMWYENGQLRADGVAKDGQAISKKEWDEDGNER